jgi:hypothetical protein
MDVTPAILERYIKYGVADRTQSSTLSVSKSLNFTKGASIEKPFSQTLTTFPLTLNYTGNIGLFGAENVYLKFSLNINSAISLYQTVETPDGYSTVIVSRGGNESSNDYESALESYPTLNGQTYTESEYNSKLSSPDSARISVDLNNLKTNNQYVDNWLDVSLYDSNKLQHESNSILVGVKDVFYVGLHARRSVRLPYNISIEIGREYLSINSMTDDQRRQAG